MYICKAGMSIKNMYTMYHFFFLGKTSCINALFQHIDWTKRNLYIQTEGKITKNKVQFCFVFLLF